MLDTQMSPERKLNEAQNTGAQISVGARSPTTGHQSNFDNAIGYLEYVRTRFATQPDVYDDFLKIMKNCYLGTISRADTTAQVSVLFDGDAELVQRFETFL
jgi:paired amphipathic helix protein Sin3a